jgi:hypothetical protein
MIGFEEIKFSVGGQQSGPVSISGSSAKEEFNLYSGEFHFRLPVERTQASGVSDLLPCLKKLYQLSGTSHLPFITVFGFGHLDHTQKMTPDMSGSDKPYDIGTSKPTVREQIIKTYPFFDCSSDHVYSFLDFFLRVLFNSLLYGFSFLALPAVLLLTLFPGHPERFFRPAPFFTMKRKVQNGLRLAISATKKKSLKAEDGVMSHVRKYPAYSLDLFAGFGQVRIINNEANRILASAGISPDRDFPDQLQIDLVQDPSPIQRTIGHKAVENILPARENLKQNGFRIMKSIFDHE